MKLEFAGVYVGDIECEVDGYYVFYPASTSGGYWSESLLRAIADKLAKLNKKQEELMYPTD